MNGDRRAPRRTMLAEDRTALAAERILAAWLRTGLSFLAAALAAQRLLGDVVPGVELRVLASVLAACAVACFGAAIWRDARVRLRLDEPHIHLLPRVLILGIAMPLIVVSAAAAVLIWLA